MATLTEMVAAVVVHSSAAAFSHFGVTLDMPQARGAPAPAERVVARTPRRALEKTAAPAASDCPESQRARLQRA